MIWWNLFEKEHFDDMPWIEMLNFALGDLIPNCFFFIEKNLQEPIIKTYL